MKKHHGHPHWLLRSRVGYACSADLVAQEAEHGGLDAAAAAAGQQVFTVGVTVDHQQLPRGRVRQRAVQVRGGVGAARLTWKPLATSTRANGSQPHRLRSLWLDSTTPGRAVAEDRGRAVRHRQQPGLPRADAVVQGGGGGRRCRGRARLRRPGGRAGSGKRQHGQEQPEGPYRGARPATSVTHRPLFAEKPSHQTHSARRPVQDAVDRASTGVGTTRPGLSTFRARLRVELDLDTPTTKLMA